MQLRKWISGTPLHRTSILLFMVGVIVSSVAPLLAAHTLSYEPETIHIVGILQREVFPGPPNYENIRTGDSPETVWFVALDNDAGKVTETGERRIQLILPENQYTHLLNQTVVVTGTLFDAHTVHHHTPVLMFVTKLQTY
jgi:hypothetical protein